MTIKELQPLGKGYVQVYTGNSKGKTTAALGLAFRAMGRGLRTYIGQFMKGQHCGEVEAAKIAYPYITIEQYGRDSLVNIQNLTRKDYVQMAEEGLERALEAMFSGEYDIIVLDEITTAYHFHLVSLKDILEILATKPYGVEIVFTGRYAPPELIASADLVTEMVEIKHYYRNGVEAREGIER